MYYIALFFVKLVSLLPFRLLYILSDFSYIIIYYLTGYRKKVVRSNLINSFPDKMEQELKKIEKKFYHHFCDIIFESLKLMSVRAEVMDKRMQYIGRENILQHYEEGRSVMMITSHIGNWEWLSTFSRYLPKDKPVYQVYRRQRNKTSDRVIGKLRRRFGAENVEMGGFYRKLVKLNQTGKLRLFGVISDQSPGRNSIRYWTSFLNQHTAMIDGAEQLARRFDYPVYYCGVKKVKRGYYVATFELITTEPKNTEEHEITETYARLLERDILASPEIWLWSHKRWKHKFEEWLIS